MIDFHSHIIPCIDDGSNSLDMSNDMLSNSNNQGIEYICATPHFICGEHEVEYATYVEKLCELQEKLNSEVKIIQGLEVYINPDLPKLFRDKKIWGYNGKRYMLIELPMQQFPIYTEKVFYQLRLLGVTPVLAHPERNFSILKNPELLINLVEQGNLAQLNAGSLTGLYGTEIRKFAEKLVRMNLIHILGSDGHNNTRRNTDIREGFNRVKELNNELYLWINNNEEKIIDGIELEVPEIITNMRKKSFFNIFRKSE